MHVYSLLYTHMYTLRVCIHVLICVTALDVKYVFSVFETEAKTLVFLVFLELQGP